MVALKGCPPFQELIKTWCKQCLPGSASLDGSQSHMIGTISLHPVVHIHKINEDTAATSLRPNRDVLHLVHRDDVGVGLEQVASLNFTMMMAGMRAVSSYANT